MLDLHAVFEEFTDDFLKFKRIKEPKHPREDICAFLMLHDLLGGKRDMVSAAEHDEIWLDVDCDELAKKATREFIRDLTRYGVRYDSDTDSLCMFV